MPGQWLARCRDIAGRRRQVVVTPTEDGRVAVILPAGEVAVLELLAVGQLRAALRDVAFASAGADHRGLHGITTAGTSS